MNKVSSYKSFRFEGCFADEIAFSLCGFCQSKAFSRLESCYDALRRQSFGPVHDGQSADLRLNNLLEAAFLPVRAALGPIAACVRVTAAEGPCGGILGLLYEAPKSGGEAPEVLKLPTGERWRLFTAPGLGAAAFYVENNSEEQRLLDLLRVDFPHPGCIRQLEAAAELGLWVTDHDPASPLELNGSCGTFKRNNDINI